MAKKISVIVVDDSALMRQILSTMLNSDPDIEVVATAPDPVIARRKIRELNPDVITLDVEMPKMDGLTFLEKIMALRPMPVVMVSTLTQEGAGLTLQALEIGAVDFVAKPTGDQREGMEQKSQEIIRKVKIAASAKVSQKVAIPKKRVSLGSSGYFSNEKLIAIGASTGGVEAIREIITQFPSNTPPILIAQHMPANFTEQFANRLNSQCAVNVFEAQDGQRIMPGNVYIAPGSHHLRLDRSGAHFVCRLDDGPLVSGHKPSVDVLFNSMAQTAKEKAIGVILTGMGSDGAEGMLAMREAGAETLGQDEASCVVYGMPRAAFEKGGVERQLPLTKIASHLVDACQSKAA